MPRTCTLKGNPLELSGPELKVGDNAPDCTVKKSLVDDLKISETSGKTRVFSVVPSLDTPVCAIQTKRFFDEASKLDNVTFYTVSADLPTAQARFCNAEKIDPEKMINLSDHRDTAFGNAWGTLIPGLRVESRAVFVVDKNDIIRHAQYVAEVAEEPDYEAVIKAVRECAG